ncbi:DUF4179 domain-containing protein [Paenibacillus sp. GCM10027626]|uniref:DUF4179 domain-containing protein n=1 Tax=Paenibacillus sp. GCM10027626 TaxID=3273411 RepID=UPI00363D2E04
MDNNLDEQWRERFVQDREILEKQIKGVDDEKLIMAIHNGLNKGKARPRPRRRWRLSIGMGTALLALMLLFAVSVKVSPVFANALRQIPGLSVFVNMLEADPAVKIAIDNNFIQPIGKTVEKDGVHLTVEGIVADEQRLIVLYTSNITGGWDSTRLQFKFFDQQDNELQGLISFDHSSIGKTAMQSRGEQDFVDLQLTNGKQMPSQVRMEAMVNETKLDVDIPIEHSRFSGMKQEIPINRTIEIDGDRITFESMVISPLNMQLKIREDAGNLNKVKGFIGMVIEDEKGREWQEKNGYGLSDTEKVLGFQSNYFEKPRQLVIKASGIYRVPKGAKLVVNTETMSIIKAPDSRVSLIQVESKQQYDQLEFRIGGIDDIEGKFISYSLVDSTFTDGAGNKHKLAEVDRFTSGSMDSRYPDQRNIYVPLPKGKLQQPLTFELADYPGYVEQPVELEIEL